MKYCGREFSSTEIEWIRQEIQDNPQLHRKGLSIRFCERYGWRKPDGELKAMSCRVVMLRMERDGLLVLPARQMGHHPPRKRDRRTLFGEPRPDVHRKASEWDLEFEVVGKKSSALWNELIDRYHYLGYMPLPGAQVRYFVRDGEQIVALLGFSAAAWKTEPRDKYIGWSTNQRKEKLQYVVNNSRYLILPWIHSKCLASKILAMAAKRLIGDWEERYKYQPALLETFVEKERFSGTCYKAAGWVCVGETKGRGKLDVHNWNVLPIKTVWLYPLVKDFRNHLCEGGS